MEAFVNIILELATEEELRGKLFEGMYITETYRDFWDMLSVLPDGVSIVLQRFYYYYKSVKLESGEMGILKEVKKGLEKDSMGYLNLEAILN